MSSESETEREAHGIVTFDKILEDEVIQKQLKDLYESIYCSIEAGWIDDWECVLADRMHAIIHKEEEHFEKRWGEHGRLKLHLCEKHVCERISEYEGVCVRCEINDLNNGDYHRCENDDCSIILCDNCGDNTSTYILGGDASVFLCCDICFEEVKNIHPSMRNFQAERKRKICRECEL